MRSKHTEIHFAERIGWLRASVLGANDGIVSTASLIVGVAASHGTMQAVLTAGIAGLVAGSMAMAAGEYVSVSSQADTEAADLARETAELAADPAHEHDELKEIYMQRGLDDALADQVAFQLMKHDALGAHMRDELGLSGVHTAKPLQAAMASAASFAIGAGLPLLLVLLSSIVTLGALTASTQLITITILGSIIFLILLGIASAKAGGSHLWTSVSRVVFWGVLAMGVTALVGKLFGTAVA
jgi:VIT1/CCC1 family predicted Fe2+/Mn2+ transporter